MNCLKPLESKQQRPDLRNQNPQEKGGQAQETRAQPRMLPEGTWNSQGRASEPLWGPESGRADADTGVQGVWSSWAFRGQTPGEGQLQDSRPEVCLPPALQVRQQPSAAHAGRCTQAPPGGSSQDANELRRAQGHRTGRRKPRLGNRNAVALANTPSSQLIPPKE